MKKLFIIAAVIALILPNTVFALEQMSDQAMEQITGQAGVSIAVDDVKIYQSIDGLSYTDTDGTDGEAGTVSLDNLTVMVHANAITSLDGVTGLPFSPGREVQGTYGAYNYNNVDTTADGIDDLFLAHALTIDVGTCSALSAGLSNNVGAAVTVAGVVIGLPTLEIAQSALSFDVTVASGTALNSGASFGTIGIGQQTVAILDGTLEIAPH